MDLKDLVVPEEILSKDGVRTAILCYVESQLDVVKAWPDSACHYRASVTGRNIIGVRW